MKLEDQVKQLTELMADLVPTVDRLALNQEKSTEAINSVAQNQDKTTKALQEVIEVVGKTNMAMGEMRTSNIKLAEAIERLVVKIDKIDRFEERLIKLERQVFK